MTRTKTALAALIATLAGAPLDAVVMPRESAARDLEFRHPRLFVEDALVPLGAFGPRDAARLRAELADLGLPASAGLYDVHAGRWASLLLRQPLIPGHGVENGLLWPDFGFAGRPAAPRMEAVAWTALARYVERTKALRIDLAQLAPPRVTVHHDGTLVQIHAQRTLSGIPVRDSALSAVINHGNLVLLGLRHWADAAAAVRPTLDADAAHRVAAIHLGGASLDGAPAHLELVPFAREPATEGYDFRLVWVVEGHIAGDHGAWEALVDAAGGELLAFEDRNHYATAKRIVGGVYPLSNDGLPPDGVEQPGTPMPFTDVRLPDGTSVFTNSSGVIGCVGSPGPGSSRLPFLRTTLSGRYVTIADGCGAVRERWLASSELAGDLGFGPGTDCAVPPGHSAGDTHAARTGFYELNRIAEQARGYLPANTWLQSPLVANMNVPPTCGAFWNGTALTFFRAGTPCRNPGEIAGALSHEWGHGMDDNGANPTISNPAEAIADIHAILRLDESCVGRGFFSQVNCGGYGDPCTECTGVRDLDWAKHLSGVPHAIPWVQSQCPTGSGPCGRQPHCSSIIVSEAIWDLRARDLPTLFGMDDNTALELTTRLAYLGGGMVGTWYQCAPPAGGCSALGGYLNLLAADDDNGNLLDGTPHMTAIHSAFNRHQIACTTPAPQDSGCGGGPATAPTLTVTAQDESAALSWTAVPGAARYAVHRNDGVRGCASGKARVAETSGTSFDDLGLLNGFSYSYVVLPIGANGSCLGPMSACESAVPAGPGLCALTPAPPR